MSKKKVTSNKVLSDGKTKEHYRKVHEIEDCLVVSHKEGSLLGKVHHLYLNATEKKISAIVIKKNILGEKFFIEAKDVHSIGDEVVFINSKKSIQPIEKLDTSKNKEVGKMRGKWVTTTDGTHVGYCEDLEVNTETFKIEDIFLEENMKVLVSPEKIVIGEDEIIISEDYKLKKSKSHNNKAKGLNGFTGLDIVSSLSSKFQKNQIKKEDIMKKIGGSTKKTNHHPH